MGFIYSKTCVREPPSRLTLSSGWCGKSCLSYKGTCHVILLAKLHDMYLYKTNSFPHQPLRSISKVAVLHRFYCIYKTKGPVQHTCALWLEPLLFSLRNSGFCIVLANGKDPDESFQTYWLILAFSIFVYWYILSRVYHNYFSLNIGTPSPLPNLS